MAGVTLAANVGNGTASIQVTDSRTSGYDYYETYQFTASAADGWTFVRWESRARYIDNFWSSTYTTGEWSDWGAAEPYSTFTYEFFIKEEIPPDPNADPGSQSSYGYYFAYDREYRAVFERTTHTTHTVTTAADPVAGGTVTGGGQYQAGSSCTITATPNSGYIFEMWSSSDGTTTINNPYYFTVSKDITWTARFRAATGRVLHGAAGMVLHGAGGSVLFSG